VGIRQEHQRPGACRSGRRATRGAAGRSPGRPRPGAQAPVWSCARGSCGSVGPDVALVVDGREPEDLEGQFDLVIDSTAIQRGGADQHQQPHLYQPEAIGDVRSRRPRYAGRYRADCHYGHLARSSGWSWLGTRRPARSCAKGSSPLQRPAHRPGVIQRDGQLMSSRRAVGFGAGSSIVEPPGHGVGSTTRPYLRRTRSRKRLSIGSAAVAGQSASPAGPNRATPIVRCDGSWLTR
jgi:hypothetical protein